MLKKRIIPCLDIKDGRTVKGVNFEGLRDAGDPVELAKKYEQDGADELVFLDITAGIEKRSTLLTLVEKLAQTLSIPFTVGGGITTLADAEKVIQAGADKVSINSAAFRNPDLITEIAGRFGSQCVVVAIDTTCIDNQWKVALDGGRSFTNTLAIDWCKQAEKYGAGEILLTSMQGDGSKLGYSLGITKQIAAACSIPVIASGGAGSREHFEEIFQYSQVNAALAASLFHFNELSIRELKIFLSQQQIPVRL